MAAQAIGDEANGAGASEGIKDGSANRAPGFDARLDEGRRERGEMGVGKG